VIHRHTVNIPAEGGGKMSRYIPFPTELDPFLIQIVAVGVGQDLPGAIEAAVASLRTRATQMRTQGGFPIIHGMFFALTNKLERFSEPGQKTDTTATLAAWYHLDCGRNLMTPLPQRSIGPVATSIIQEYDVVFCEGY
jgi:hypothetical protein